MPPMQRLDLDIVTEGILPLLGVEDILSLRRVNKLFYRFSKDWLLWKRLLEHLPIPTSPFFRHYETIVIQAIKLDDNFRDTNTRIEHLQVASRWNVIGYRPLDAKFLLGGHYLVVCARRKFKTVRDHVITIFQKGSPFDPPTFKIPSRAYCLDAKYLVYKGVPGIMISYVLRASLATSPSANLDDLEYDGDNGRGYDMVCNFVSMESLKRMYDKANSANPMPSGVHMIGVFGNVTPKRIWDPKLFAMDNGRPFLAFVEQLGPTGTNGGDVIRLYSLDSPSGNEQHLCTVIPPGLNRTCRIRCIYVLPEQGDILVVCALRSLPTYLNFVALFPFHSIPRGKAAAVSFRLRYASLKQATRTWISDAYMPSCLPVRTTPPITIYGIHPHTDHADDLTEKTSEYSLTKHSIYPKKTTTIVNGVPVDKWVYSILEQGWHEEVPAGTGSVTKVAIPPRVGPISIKIILGVHRTLVLGFVKDLNPRTLLRGRPLSKLHFMHRLSPVDISVPGEALARGRKALPEELVAPVVDEGYASMTGAEVSVVAWDEWSGKGFWFGERHGEWKAFRL